jgi:hypothetical protein
VNFIFLNINYEVEKPPEQHPIGGPRVVSVMQVEGSFKYSVNCARAAVNYNIDYEVGNLFKYSVNRARAAAVNSLLNIDYEVKKTSRATPYRRAAGGECNVSGRRLQVQCEPRTGGGC